MLTDILLMFGADDYYPHGICLGSDPVMVWAYTMSDLLTCGSYVVIGAAIAVYRFCRLQLKAYTLLLMTSFIVMCGFTHMTEAIEIYVSIYRLDLALRIATALLSSATAVQMIRRLGDESRRPGGDPRDLTCRAAEGVGVASGSSDRSDASEPDRSGANPRSFQRGKEKDEF